jgi:hypothetical protein
MDTSTRKDSAETPADARSGEPWIKPAIASFEPVKAAEGISYNPLDGLANLTI